MSETPIIGFRLVGVNTTEAGKAASANENALIAEALFKQRVESRTTTDPPGSPDNADVYIVPDASASPAPSGAWAGHEDEIAIYYNGWLFVAPINGPVFYVADEDLSVKYDDTASPPAWVVGGASTFIGQSDTPASYSGQAGKAAVVNSGETGLEFGASASTSGAKAVLTTNEAISASTNTVILWDSEEYDDDGYFELGTDAEVLTIPATGRYRLTFAPQTDNEAADTAWQYWITKNGSAFGDRIAYADQEGTSRGGVTVIYEGQLASGDVLRAMMFCSQATNLLSITSFFSIQKIG